MSSGPMAALVAAHLEPLFEPDSDSDSDDEPITKEAAGRILFDYIVSLKQLGKLSAVDACQLAWWAANAGAEGLCAQLGKAPGDKATGHYSRHFDTVAGVDVRDPCLYTADVPQYSKINGSREVLPLAFRCPHEDIAKEINERPHFEQELDRVAAQMPPTYHDHPVVRRALPTKAVPLGFFCGWGEIPDKGVHPRVLGGKPCHVHPTPVLHNPEVKPMQMWLQRLVLLVPYIPVPAMDVLPHVSWAAPRNTA